MKANKQTRGVRNNNPGNIDYNAGTKWQGLANPPIEDHPHARFARFTAPEWGVRAIAKVLITYQDKHHRASVRQIINRWAPPKENNTQSYISAVAADIGVDPGEPVNVHHYKVMRALVEAIIEHENAGYHYPPDVITEGLRRAGVVAPPKPVVKDLDIVTGAGGTASGGVAGAVEAVQETMDGVSQLTPYLDTAKWLFLALSIGLFGFTLWRLYRKLKVAQAGGA